MYKLNLEKAQEQEIKLSSSNRSEKKQENSRKKYVSLTTLKPLTVWITTSCEKSLKRWEYQFTSLNLLRNLYAGQESTVKTGHGTTDWLQIGKGVLRLYIVTLLI